MVICEVENCHNELGGPGDGPTMCSVCRSALAEQDRGERMNRDFAPDWDDRFWSKCCPEALSGCWLWHAAMVGRYGAFTIGSRRDGSRAQHYAHRHAHTLAHGPIPDGLYVCHRCDVPACVNPAHLFLGTHADNMADMTAKGRRRSTPLPGERNGSARLRRADVEDLRRRHAAGANSQDLATMFGISKSHTWRITARKSWSDGNGQ